MLAIGLAAAADLAGEPIGLLDAGCSAGLNLLIDRYRFEYGPFGSPRAEEDRAVETAETTGAVGSRSCLDRRCQTLK